MGVFQQGVAALSGAEIKERVVLRKALPQERVLSARLVNGAAGATLAAALRAAGDVNAAPALREAAAQQLLSELRSWAPGLIAGRYRGRLHGLASDEIEALGADAVQHALLAAVRSSHFRGDNDESARAWLRTVLSNFVADDLRKRKRKRMSLVVPAFSEASDVSEDGARVSSVLARDLEHALRFLRSLRSFVVANHRSQDAETLLRAAWVQLSYAAGSSTEEQVRLWMRDGLADTQPSPSEQKRLQDRIYQMRHRGRDIILRACASDAQV